MSLRRISRHFLWISLIFISPAYAQRGGTSSGSLSLLEVDVQLRFPDGTPGPEGIHLLLETAAGGVDADCQTREGGKCRMRPSSTGVYNVILDHGGFAADSQRVELVGILHAYVTLTWRSTNAPAKETVTSIGPPILSPKAQKELSRGLQELSAAKPDE